MEIQLHSPISHHGALLNETQEYIDLSVTSNTRSSNITDCFSMVSVTEGTLVAEQESSMKTS